MKTSAHEKFLEMLGWEGDELKSFLPDWKRAAKLMGLSDKDVAFAVEQWIPAYWDLSLSGVKKFRQFISHTRIDATPIIQLR